MTYDARGQPIRKFLRGFANCEAFIDREFFYSEKDARQGKLRPRRKRTSLPVRSCHRHHHVIVLLHNYLHQRKKNLNLRIIMYHAESMEHWNQTEVRKLQTNIASVNSAIESTLRPFSTRKNTNRRRETDMITGHCFLLLWFRC